MILAQAFARGAIVIIIAALLTLALGRRSAAIRHHIWASAIVIQLALIAFIPLLPTISLPMLPTITVFNAEEAARPPIAADAGTTEAPVASSTTTSQAPKLSRSQALDVNWNQLLLTIWLTGASLIFLRYLIGTLLMARLAHKARRVDEGEWLALTQRIALELGITRPVTLLWGDKLAVPITWGILYPMILLPESASEWSHERRRFVLVHELAHVRRFDAFTQLIAQITLAIFWFSPFVWLSEWRLRVEREHACDDVVIQHGTEPTRYADELLQIVRSLVSRKAARPAFAALAMARKSEFEGRMLAILDPARRRSATGIGTGLLFLALSLLIAAPLAAIDPFAFNVTVVQEPTPPVAAPVVQDANEPERPLYVCKHSDLKPGNSQQTSVATAVHGHTGDDPLTSYVEVQLVANDSCIVGLAMGDVSFTAGNRDVARMPKGALVRLHEVTRTGERFAEFRPDADGVVQRTFKDADASWVANVLPRVLSAMARPNTASSTPWPNTWRERNATTARLGNLDNQLANASSNLADLEKALSTISSDGELRTFLVAQLPTADRSMLLMLARSASTLSSGFETSEFLIAAVPSYFAPGDSALQDAWFAVASLLSSSYEHKKALIAALPYARDNTRVRGKIAQSASLMSSDSDKAAVLSALTAIR